MSIKIEFRQNIRMSIEFDSHFPEDSLMAANLAYISTPGIATIAKKESSDVVLRAPMIAICKTDLCTLSSLLQFSFTLTARYQIEAPYIINDLTIAWNWKIQGVSFGEMRPHMLLNITLPRESRYRFLDIWPLR